MALNKNPAMSPSSSAHGGQYDTLYATIGCVLRKAFAGDTILGVHRESARTMIVEIATYHVGVFRFDRTFSIEK